MRRRYFPPERNLIPAHLTLFHHLPDEEQTFQMIRAGAEGCMGSKLAKPQLRSIGRGVAVFFEAKALDSLHASLLSDFQEHLIPQDRQRLQPHIVVQNKVDPATALQTLAELKDMQFVEPQWIGLTVWRYLGGPWERLVDLPLGAPGSRQAGGSFR